MPAPLKRPKEHLPEELDPEAPAVPDKKNATNKIPELPKGEVEEPEMTVPKKLPTLNKFARTGTIKKPQ